MISQLAAAAPLLCSACSHPALCNRCAVRLAGRLLRLDLKVGLTPLREPPAEVSGRRPS